MILLVAGSHFVVIFIGLEMLSLSIYVLAAFAKKDPLSAESGMKYFLLGSFASAFFLYGAAFIYGATGSLQLNESLKFFLLQPQRDIRFCTRNYFSVSGICIQNFACAFSHVDSDVYEGRAYTSHCIYGCNGESCCACQSASSISSGIPISITILATINLDLGGSHNVLRKSYGIMQNNLKRLLAYSSIAHAGYMLTGLLAKPAQSEQTILYYFATYAFMNLGAFAVVGWLERPLKSMKYRNIKAWLIRVLI